jgi:hypothetical protein
LWTVSTFFLMGGKKTMADPRYRRTKYGTLYVGFNPRHRRPRPLCRPEIPETYGWQPAYTHPELQITVYHQAGCKLAKLPDRPGWLAQNRHGVLYHYTLPLAHLTPDRLADTCHPPDP